MDPSVFIVIVTYNAVPWLELCCAPFRELPDGWKLLIVDNASSDGTAAAARQFCPQAGVIENPVNLGFGAGNNIALRIALREGADHVLLLNQDAQVRLEDVQKLAELQRGHPEYGLLSPVHLEKTGTNLDSGFARSCLPKHCGELMRDALSGTLREIYPATSGNAAAWLLSKECLAAVGGFNPVFFHYGEDNNYLHRVLFHGFRFGIAPHVVIRHHRPQHTKKKALGHSYTDTLIRFCNPSAPERNGLALCAAALPQVIALLGKGNIAPARFILRNHIAGLGGNVLSARRQSMNRGPSFLE